MSVSTTHPNPFHTLQTFSANGASHPFYSLPALEESGFKVSRMGKNRKIIDPLVPVDLVVDHSVQVDCAGSADALKKTLELEFTRNRERYRFLTWGMQAFDTFKVVPPGIGIVHQVNLEFL